jgi:hypothetical protein
MAGSHEVGSEAVTQDVSRWEDPGVGSGAADHEIDGSERHPSAVVGDEQRCHGIWGTVGRKVATVRQQR